MSHSEILERLHHDPFLREWLRKGQLARASGNEWRAETIADVLGERANWAHLIAERKLGGVGGESLSPETASAFAERIMGANPIFWDFGMVNAAQQVELPRHTVAPDACPMDEMWWAFPGTMDMVDGSGVMRVQAALVSNYTDRINVIGIYETDEKEGLFVNTLATIRHRDVFPRADDPAANGFLAMLAFMQSPLLTEVTPRHMTRAERRRFPEENAQALVNYVTLRRRQYESREHGSGESASREYSIRWIVSGHMRAQWYPSLEAHRLIWIAPYVKGPDSAPLKQTIYKVVR